MDLEALQYTKDHYNRHAGQFADTREALQARAEGPSAPLKKFHNTIKRRLIHRFASDADSLLDLACGRGGDIIKWFDARVRYVKGIDLSPGEVAEARQRYEKMRGERPRASTTCEFVDTPLLGLKEWKEPQQYDVVTCMFALHYFFVAEAALKQFLHNVSANLKPGGYFVGTVPDGKRINECIRSNKVFDSPMLRIEARWQGAPQTFGSPYVCAIGDTVTSAEKDTEGSLEYLVYSNVLQGVAAQYGLRPVLDYSDADLEQLFDPADTGKLLKHFAPHFRGSDPSLERASELFTAFVFQKKEVVSGEESGAALAAAAAPVPGALPRAADLPPVKQPSEASGGGKGAKRGREDDARGEGNGAADEQQRQQQASGSGQAKAQPSAAAKAPAQTYKRPPPRRRPGAATQQVVATVTAGSEAPPPAACGVEGVVVEQQEGHGGSAP